MDGQDLLISLGALILIIFIASSSFMGHGSNIVNAVSEKYPLISNDDGVRIYRSNNDIRSTVNNIVSIKKPYDQKMDLTRGSILLYDESVIVVQNQSGTTEVEVIKNHQRAYNRHRGTMILFWGNNLFRNGRIRTPRSMRKGSIGSSPSLGGGFGFGK
jgi:outer membrane lipoprotein-sorting protein